MGLVHTCFKYGYMQAHTMEIHDLKNLSPNKRFMESQVSGLAKSDYESNAMRVTCIIICIILHTTHNILHITHNILQIPHNIFHIICSYAIRPWNHWLKIITYQNEGSTYGTWTREPSLSRKICFIHSYVLHFHSFVSLCKHQPYLVFSLRFSSGLLCNDQEWPSVIT